MGFPQSAALVAGFVLLALVSAAATAAADPGDSRSLFFIKRSKNANEVHYDARVDAACAWRRPEIDYYWRDLALGPDVVSEIMPWEPPAYGFDVDRAGDAEITIRLNALPDKPITARLAKTATGCRVSSTVEIGGTRAELRSVYVHAEEKKFLGIPYGATVHYIYLLGHVDDGRQRRPVYELKDFGTGATPAIAAPDDSLWTSGAVTRGRR